MKNERIALIIIVVVVVLIGLAVFYLHPFQQSPSQITPSPSSSPESAYCLPSELEAVTTIEGAAGSTYGNSTIKNISHRSCQIAGDNFMEPVFADTNISVQQEATAGSSLLSLDPDQIVYSRFRYPNGAQCTNTKTSSISFQYRISPSDVVQFNNTDGKSEQPIIICSSDVEMTGVDVWSIFDSENIP